MIDYNKKTNLPQDQEIKLILRASSSEKKVQVLNQYPAKTTRPVRAELQWLQEQQKGHTSEAAYVLLALRPKTHRVLQTETIKVKINDKVRFKTDR
jgi:pyruvate/2-oxoglutarate dehydrogenase complex dihydrolipoamide dehydrogenase (E3) component